MADVEWSEDRLNDRLTVTHWSGLVSGLAQAERLLLTEAGKFFARSQDTAAHVTRELAAQVREMMKQEEAKYNELRKEYETRHESGDTE